MVPSVTNRMVIIEIAVELLYSGGPNGLGRIFVSVHNATTDPSTELKNVANAYEVLINLSEKSRSAPDDQFVQPFPYRVKFETDGGTNHRAMIFKIYCISWYFLYWKHGYSCGNLRLSWDFVPEHMQYINVAAQYWTLLTGDFT